MAHPTCVLALSMPRISTRFSVPLLCLRQPAVEGAPQDVVAGRPRRTRSLQMNHTGVVVVAQLEANLQELRWQGGDDGVAPLDEGDALVVEQLAQAEVEQLLKVLESVGVDVHDRER